MKIYNNLITSFYTHLVCKIYFPGDEEKHLAVKITIFAAGEIFQLIVVQTESFSHLQEVTPTMQEFKADYVRLLLTKPPKNMIQTDTGTKKNGGNPHGYQNPSCRCVIPNSAESIISESDVPFPLL